MPKRRPIRPALSRCRACTGSAITAFGPFRRTSRRARPRYSGAIPTSVRTSRSSSAAIRRRWCTPPPLTAPSRSRRRPPSLRRAITACGSLCTNPAIRRARSSRSGRWATAGSTWATARAPRGPRVTSTSLSPTSSASKKGKSSISSWIPTATTRMISSAGAPPWRISTTPTMKPTTRRSPCRRSPLWRTCSRLRLQSRTILLTVMVGGLTRPAAMSTSL